MQRTPVAIAVLSVISSALVSSAALAQTAPALTAAPAPAKPAADSKSDAAKIQSVEVKGSAADYDPRRDDTASKTVINSAEIMKFGDTNVFDVLKRAPGVTVIGNSIRMRGLGNGYTQILVNGERPPPGFSMDALTPDQIERIEVIRAASAEYSMQAIAGTINIVLRSVVSKPQRDLGLMATRAKLFHFRMAHLNLADKQGRLSWFLNAGLAANRVNHVGGGARRFWLPDGTLTKSEDMISHFDRDAESLSLSARLNYKLPSGDDLNVQLRGQAERHALTNDSIDFAKLGSFTNPDYVESDRSERGRRRNLFGEVNWIAKIGGGKLDAKLNVNGSHGMNDSFNTSYTEERADSLVQRWDSTTRGGQQGLNIKFNRSLMEGHALSTGIELQRQTNEENRDRLELRSDAPTRHIIETFEPTIVKLAGYVQDEWNVTKNWSLYLGARWEQLRTDSRTLSTDDGYAETHSRNQVLSPVAQTLYKFPDKSGRQLRLALTRTFKAPTTDQLTARRYESIDNNQFSPDFGGNPDLEPELANGIDLTYEHFWSPGAVFSVTASAREIDDYIRSRLGQDRDGRWVYRPVNAGSASVRSLDLELKFPLRAIAYFGKEAPPLDLRFNVSRNWSKVESVPGPDNRLDAQTPLSATAGVDYRQGPLTTGASVVYRRGGYVQISAEESQIVQSRTDVDTYLLWKFSPRYSTRVTLSNLAKRDQRSYRQYLDRGGRQVATSSSPDSIRIGANLEIKF